MHAFLFITVQPVRYVLLFVQNETIVSDLYYLSSILNYPGFCFKPNLI